LQKLILLSLDRSPALDVLTRGTLPAWVEAITEGRQFVEGRDEPRFKAAFRTLQGRCTSWPAPREFLEAMPPLPGAPRHKRLDSDNARACGMRAIAEINAMLGISDDHGGEQGDAE
jgi:hypothetical protein